MLDLEPLIADFVDDLLATLRQATVDELHELLGNGTPPAHARSVAKPRRATRARPAVQTRTRSPSTTKRRRASKASAPRADRSVVAEITDPEWLLAVAVPSPPPLPLVRAPATMEEEPRPSGDRPATAAHGSLREGERLARPSGAAGVVIRRAKRV